MGGSGIYGGQMKLLGKPMTKLADIADRNPSLFSTDPWFLRHTFILRTWLRHKLIENLAAQLRISIGHDND